MIPIVIQYYQVDLPCGQSLFPIPISYRQSGQSSGQSETLLQTIRTGSNRSASTFSSGVGTIPLVRPIAAIVFLVAVIRFGHTFSVLASEFRRRASAVFAVTFGSCVRSVTTIVIVITSPVAVDTAAVTASKLFGRAAVASRTIERSGILISSVDTIRITITNPFTRNTLSFACKETICKNKRSNVFCII